MSRRSTPLTDELYAYYLETSVRESDVHRRLREETGKLDDANMQISPEQGQFMTLFVAAIGARTAIEIGTFTGYSALCIAQGLPADGRLIALDIDDEWPSFGKRYWAEAGVGHKIDFRPGAAKASLDAMIEEGREGDFDFVFIDADKENLDAYYDRALRLVRSGGVIAVDNTLWHGKVADPSVSDAATKAIRGFNARVIDDTRVTLSLLPIGDGLTLIRKK
jgi:predicted O-methyltransferase YrrM